MFPPDVSVTLTRSEVVRRPQESRWRGPGSSSRHTVLITGFDPEGFQQEKPQPCQQLASASALRHGMFAPVTDSGAVEERRKRMQADLPFITAEWQTPREGSSWSLKATVINDGSAHVKQAGKAGDRCFPWGKTQNARDQGDERAFVTSLTCFGIRRRGGVSGTSPEETTQGGVKEDDAERIDLQAEAGGMQTTNCGAEVSEGARLYTKSPVHGLGYSEIRVWGWQQLCHFAGGGVFMGENEVGKATKYMSAASGLSHLRAGADGGNALVGMPAVLVCFPKASLGHHRAAQNSTQKRKTLCACTPNGMGHGRCGTVRLGWENWEGSPSSRGSHRVVTLFRNQLKSLSQEDTGHDNCVGWHVERCSSTTAASAASHFKAKGADGPRCTRGGYLRESTPDPVAHTPIASRCACFQVFDPLPPAPLALKCETCIDYSIPPPSNLSENRYWIAAPSRLQHAYSFTSRQFSTGPSMPDRSPAERWLHESLAAC
ncbi:unnamed protein product [Pleuronectes platessa]|uniref:Uncharacterized protein n=1 Tax=Pleuronectes platessa TaxID=8262 RepID=A0A9N7VQ95_PLEPL|nr:unnamed protein product [Pleuronectes platessa]